MFFVSILYSKIIYDQAEHYGSPLVAPETKGCGRLVVTCFLNTDVELFVGDSDRLGQAIHTLTNVKIYPSVAGVLGEVIFIGKLLGDVGKFDFDVLWAVKWGTEAKCFYIEGSVFGALSGEDAVEKDVEKLQGCRVCTCVPKV